MYMNNFDRQKTSAEASSRAIRAVERQAEVRRRNESTDNVRKRQLIFALLDTIAPAIFTKIAEAATVGRRDLYLGAIGDFRAGCDVIFPERGLGMYDPQYVQDWLLARDLSHLFRATGDGISW